MYAEFSFKRKKKARRDVETRRGDENKVLCVISIKSLDKVISYKSKRAFNDIIRGLLVSEGTNMTGPVAMIEVLVARAFAEGYRLTKQSA